MIRTRRRHAIDEHIRQILAIYVYLICEGQLEQMRTNRSSYDLFPLNSRFAQTLIEHCDDWLSWSPKPVQVTWCLSTSHFTWHQSQNVSDSNLTLAATLDTQAPLLHIDAVLIDTCWQTLSVSQNRHRANSIQIGRAHV